MKRIIALILAVVMCLALVACGSEKALSKEELLAQAEDVTANDINNESFENLARAKQMYRNKILRLEGEIEQIEEDHVVLGCDSTYYIDVYLSLDELIKLDSGQRVIVVGKTTDEIINSSENIAGYTFDESHYQMTNAYLVQDRFEITGILKGVNTSYAPAYNIQIGNSDYLRLIYFSESVDTSTLEFGQEITFSATCIHGSLNWEYYDAEIIA